MRRALLLLALVALLCIPAGTAAPFLQAGYDAGRTGHVPGPAVVEHEVALRAQVPGQPVSDAAPVVLEGQVYVLIAPYTPTPTDPEAQPRPTLERAGVARIDPDTGEVEMVVELEAPASTMASDGQRLYLAEADGVAAYGLEGGAPLWTWSFPEVEAGQAIRTTCVEPAVLEGQLHLACTQEPEDRTEATDPSAVYVHTAPALAPLFVRLDAEDGSVLATWPTPEQAGQGVQGSSFLSQGCMTTDVTGLRLEALAVASLARVLLVATHEPDHYRDGDTLGQHILYALDSQAGELAWVHCMEPTVLQYANSHAGRPGTDVLPAVAVHLDTVYLLQWRLELLDLETGTIEQTLAIQGIRDPRQGSTTSTSQTGIALRGQVLWLQSHGEVVRVVLDSGEPRIDWRVRQPPGQFERYHPLIAGDTLYVPSMELVRAVDTLEGRERWAQELGHPRENLGSWPPPTMAAADGLLVVADQVGVVTVFGRTAMSIDPIVEASERWPAPGQTVRVDLSSTQPKGSHTSLAYRADWGDGTVTAWQNRSPLEHAYEEPGTYTARFTISNEAGQQSVEKRTFEVGGTPPGEPNAIETAFARENQDLTFGLLGILVAVAGGAIGVARRRRQRTRLTDELGAVERLYAETKHRPSDCEAQLTERKAHARGLLVDGELTEEQFPILEARIDELARELRLTAVEQELDFLPHRLVRALQDVLEDGRISEMEKEGFLATLEADEVLTGAYKERVRARIEAWYARDAGSTRQPTD